MYRPLREYCIGAWHILFYMKTFYGQNIFEKLNLQMCKMQYILLSPHQFLVCIAKLCSNTQWIRTATFKITIDVKTITDCRRPTDIFTLLVYSRRGEWWSRLWDAREQIVTLRLRELLPSCAATRAQSQLIPTRYRERETHASSIENFLYGTGARLTGRPVKQHI